MFFLSTFTRETLKSCGEKGFHLHFPPESSLNKRKQLDEIMNCVNKCSSSQTKSFDHKLVFCVWMCTQANCLSFHSRVFSFPQNNFVYMVKVFRLKFKCFSCWKCFPRNISSGSSWIPFRILKAKFFWNCSWRNYGKANKFYTLDINQFVNMARDMHTWWMFVWKLRFFSLHLITNYSILFRC